MFSRVRLTRTHGISMVSGLLALATLVPPASAQTSGERALLNKSGAVAVDVKAPRRTVDGARALLNRAETGESAVVEARSAARSAPGDAKAVDGRRALLGTFEASSARAKVAPRH
jgi:hypothetical protein